MKNDKSVIPRGDYCNDENGVCPYWSLKDDLPDQFNGYCSYLDKTDLELSRKYNERIKVIHSPKGKDLGKTLDKLFNGKDWPSSLIWDGVKECNINMEK